jgi:hypothetical protein
LKPSVVTAQIHDHRNGHSIRPNKVAFKYPNFQKDVDVNAHVKNVQFWNEGKCKDF